MVTIIEQMLNGLRNNVQDLQEGVQPEILAYWYNRVIRDAIDLAPPWFEDKIKVKQDPILGMKFNLDISKRAVKYFMIAVDSNLEEMPYSTRLYFLKVQQELETECNKALI